MANVTVLSYRRERYIDGMFQGAPHTVHRGTSSANFQVSPAFQMPQGGFVQLWIVDGPIEFVAVRTGSATSVETPTPIPCLDGGMSSIIMLSEDYDNDIYYRDA